MNTITIKNPTEATTSNDSGIYYRSQIFTAESGVNPFVSAAYPILSLADSLKATQDWTDDNELRDLISHELKTFETRAVDADYSDHSISLARQILNLHLLEIIEYCPRANSIQTINVNTDETVFQIIETLCQNPQEHLDLLELIYLILSSGYEGKYRFVPYGKDMLNEIIDSLYQIIRRFRGHLKNEFFISTTKSGKASSEKPLSVWLISGLSFVVLASLYIGFSYMLNSSMQPLVQQISQLVQ